MSAVVPFFSVVIATWNRAGLLRRALDSLLAQSETDWEAWVIDDGGADDTEAVVEAYRRRSGAFHYVRCEHGGDARAKNVGIARSRGEFITFLDSDDEYAPDHLASRRSVLERGPEIALLHGGVRIVGDPWVPDRDDITRQVHLSQCVIGGTFFFRREALRALGGFLEMPFASDTDLFDRAVAAGLKVAKTEHPSYIYDRTQGGSITRALWESQQQS